jgi:putative transposase
MTGMVKINITETESDLKKLLKQQKTAYALSRLQALYLLKTQQVETVQHLAVVLGKSRVTVQRWLQRYREGGLDRLLEQHHSTGRPKIISQSVRERLLLELAQPEGFDSYGEVQTWLKASEGIEASYKVVHDTVHYQLKAKLKVPRPSSTKQSPQAPENFKKNYLNC